jgi:hypothetical protein
MFDPNVPSFFLIILCGFGVVWGYRKVSETKNVLGEFEYLAFSTLWGSLTFLPIAYFLDKKHFLAPLTVQPFMATPSLFMIGLIVGGIAAALVAIIKRSLN